MIYDANLSAASIVPLFYNEGVEQIKERVGAIMDFKKKIKLISMISLLAIYYFLEQKGVRGKSP